MAADPLINTTVGGCLILEVIGQGGMGVIYKARQKSLDRIVALKVLAPHLANDINFVSRFQKEARAIARINHPNILAVYDVGDDQNVNYMIMELIDGQSLAELQNERRGALSWEEAANYVLQASQGLEAAQSAGIIHRDIKPENLMVTKKNVIKVSDFGLAKEADASNTSVDAVMGTPAFMSPEQCDGKKVDARSDIYSLGGTFYRLITGRLPFEAETAMSMMYRHKHEALIPPHEVIAGIPQSVSALIVKMMAKKRELRPQNMSEVIDELDAALKQQPAATSADMSAVPAGPPSGMLRVPQDGPVLPPSQDGSVRDVPPMRHDTDILRRRDSRVAPMSGRMGVQPGSSFGGPADSSARLNAPSGLAGLGGSGMGVPEDAYSHVARGDEMIGRGDRIPAMKCYRQALAANTLDRATRERVETELRREASARRAAADTLIKRGMLVEASRECRMLVDVDPSDESAKTLLKDVEHKLAARRTLVNDIRTAISGSNFEKAIKLWDSATAELRDEGIGKQIEQLRNVVVPSFKLAEQGQMYAQQGRLEEAISTFEDALKINPNCEPARLGQKETEQKMQRIDFMLKEGYQASLDQNYAKAIETWKPILQLRPAHPQAVKSIVDACMALSQNLRSHGDFDGAWQACRTAAETDPQNRTVRNALDEMTTLRDKERALMDRAHDAAAHNRLGLAIHNWREVQRLNPPSKRAAQQIAELSRQRSSGMFKWAVLLSLIAAIGAGGYLWFRERELLREPREAAAAISKQPTFMEARKTMREWRIAEQLRTLEEAGIFIHKAEKQQLLAELNTWQEIDAALAKFDNSQFAEAEKELAALAKMLFAKDRSLSERLRRHALFCRVRQLNTQGMAKVENSKWDEALQYFNELKAVLQEPGLPEALKSCEAETERKAMVMQRIVTGERYERASRKSEAFREYQSALRMLGDFKTPVVAEYLKARAAAVGAQEADFTKAFEAGLAALRRTPPDLAAAQAAFKDAMKINPRAENVQELSQYAADMAECETGNMSLYARIHPLQDGGDGKYEREQAFCIDRYEWPNKAGELPRNNVTWLEASDLCRKAGKELCTSNRWTDACKGGPKFTAQWPYGNEPDPLACNTGGTGIKPSGSFSRCKNAIGVYDMSGNVAEWTAAPEQWPSAQVMGGAYDAPVSGATCIDGYQLAKNTQSLQIGFRCCRSLAPRQSSAEKP